MAEAGDLKSPQCGFESHRGYVSRHSRLSSSELVMPAATTIGEVDEGTPGGAKQGAEFVRARSGQTMIADVMDRDALLRAIEELARKRDERQRNAAAPICR